MRTTLPRLNLITLWRGLAAAMLALSLLLSGCSSAPTASVKGTTANGTILQHSQQALSRGEFGNAEQALQQLDMQTLSAQEYIQYLLLNADLHLHMQEPDLSKLFLDELDELIQPAPAPLQLQHSQLKAVYLEATGQYLNAARLRDFQTSALTGEAASANQKILWQDLMLMPEAELLAWAEQYPDTQFGQWLQLASLMRNARLTLDEQLQGVAQWQQQHPQHPAAIELPEGLEKLQDIAKNRPQNVALLLPLSGTLAKTGAAIRDGFMAAYYESLNKGFSVPKLQVYDSNILSDMNTVYAQAQFDGVQWLIGPVEKNLVQTLDEKDALPLPTLALNYSDRSEQKTVTTNLYQFGLAAEDEAQQIAEKAWADGKRHALVLAPQGAWGERVYAAFEQRWRSLGGEINGQRFYPNRQDYNPDIKALLNINDSQTRYRTMRSLLQQNTDFEPRRRQDADWVFMIALPQQARQIKPTLAFNFAADLPVYATSHIYSGEPNPSKDRDLNGIQFCDIPWLLQHSKLYDSVEKSIPNGQGSYTRLYALGVDAFRLLPQLSLLATLPHSHVFGSTGALQLDSEHRIIRRTQCTIFEQGRPKRLNAR